MVEWGYSEEEKGRRKKMRRMPYSSSHLTRYSEDTVGIQ